MAETGVAFRRIALPRGTTWWAVVGDAGAVHLAAMLWPAVLTTPSSDAANAAMGMVRTDAGWLMPVDLGEHRQIDDRRAGLVRMEDCPLLGSCWYGGR